MFSISLLCTRYMQQKLIQAALTYSIITTNIKTLNKILKNDKKLKCWNKDKDFIMASSSTL